MDIRNSSSALDNLLLQILQPQRGLESKQQILPQNNAQIDNARSKRDRVELSGQKPDNQNNSSSSGFERKNSKLTSEIIEQLENGFRRIQEFQSQGGNQFTRIEEFTGDTERATRTVIQQNASGSTIISENVLDRQDDGSFRASERFTDETGQTRTNINYNITPDNTDIILGRIPNPESQSNNPFQPARGTQLDLSA